jgi:hypothetical protein
MMVQLAANRLFALVLAIIAGYWTVMPQLTGYSNAIVSVFQVIASLFVLGSWGGDALTAIRSGRVRDAEIALIGTAIVSLGAGYQGTFNFTWWYMDEPLHWLNTPTSGFGRYLMGVGFMMQYFSGVMTIERMRRPNMIFMVLGFLASVILGILLGYNWSEQKSVLMQISMLG